jgi:transcription initiation factor TFIIIB Brf1 subunit/transcription initiation factor TFIIB
MYDWLSGHARAEARSINLVTKAAVEAALGTAEVGVALKGVFEAARLSRTDEIALTEVTTASNFGATETAKKSPYTNKTWQVNSGSPRASHAALDGETVAINERFSNGLMWPGDPTGGTADDRANCQCTVGFGRG